MQMIKTLIHGFYDEMGHRFVSEIEETEALTIVHWFGHGECKHPRGRFDWDIVDLHCGKIPEGDFEFDHSGWLEVQEHQEQIRKELIRHCFISNWKDELIASLIFSYASYCVALLRRKEVSLIVFNNIPHEGFDTILYRVAVGMGLKLRVFAELPYQYERMMNRVEQLGEFGPFSDQKCRPKVSIEEVCSLSYMKNAHQGNRSLFVEKFYFASIWPFFKFLGLKSLYLRLIYGDSGLKGGGFKVVWSVSKALVSSEL